jgi:low temperature requirement protein LtrA
MTVLLILLAVIVWRFLAHSLDPSPEYFTFSQTFTLFSLIYLALYLGRTILYALQLNGPY